MQNIIFWIQIISAILLTIVILLQHKSAGLGSAISGNSGNSYSSKRGVDKLFSISTVIFALIFFGAAIGYIFV
jgi:protein translocase SecG subunit